MWILGLEGLKTVTFTVMKEAKGITVQYQHGNTHRHYSLDPLLERTMQCYHWSYTNCAQHLIQQAKISWGIYFQKCTVSCFERAWFVEGGLWINDDPAYFSSTMSSVLHGVCNGVCKQGTRCDPVLLDSNENPSPNDFLQLMTYRYMYPQEQSCYMI